MRKSHDGIFQSLRSLIGVDMDRCPALYLAESRVELPSELKQQMKRPREWENDYPPTEWSVGYRIPEVNFVHVREVADELGSIRSTTLGASTVRYFEARAMVDIYARLRREDSYRLIDFTLHTVL
jgi:aminoglycoside N3'-acetyltransferase